MKHTKYLIAILFIGLYSCNKVIDLTPESNLTSGNFYNNASDINTGLIGAYNGLQNPMYYEWQLTELRSDNSDMGVPSSSNTANADLTSLDEFIPSTGIDAVYQYWIKTYYNIRNANVILQNLGVNYDATTGAISLGSIGITITDSLRKQYAGEALVLRAYSYFNLVRLYGGVFLTTTPIAAEDAKKLNRSSVDDIYKLIQADLTTATSYLGSAKYSATSAAIGRVNAWTAKGLLAKVYLTRNNKAAAITLLQDVIANSGYSLQSSYANVFSISNEVNSEIMFTVRYKAGNLGLGSSFGNDFAPLGSNNGVITTGVAFTGKGWNYPTNDMDTTLGGYNSITTDPRKATIMGSFGTAKVLYVKKYLNPVLTLNDGESDWPILRYADIILMLAEAQGNSTSSLALINQIRTRAGVPVLTSATVNSVATFEQALANERRVEFAFENQRFFDLVRYNTTLTTITAEQTIKDHFAKEFKNHYATYPAPQATLAQLQSYVTTQKLLLPIPQHEIDTNTQLVIAQNPGY